MHPLRDTKHTPVDVIFDQFTLIVKVHPATMYLRTYDAITRKTIKNALFYELFSLQLLKIDNILYDMFVFSLYVS